MKARRPIAAPDRTVCQHTGTVVSPDDPRTYTELLEENADLRATVEGLGLALRDAERVAG